MKKEENHPLRWQRQLLITRVVYFNLTLDKNVSKSTPRMPHSSLSDTHYA